MRKYFLTSLYILFVLSGTFFFRIVWGASNVYYSVGQNADNHSSGGDVSIISGVATFTVAQTAANLGVGDRLTAGGNVYYLASKISTTQWRVVTRLGAIPADLPSTAVTSITHEYTSLSVAEAGAIDSNHLNSVNLVGLDVVLNFPCYYDSGPDTTALTVGGYTTDETRYIRIYTPTDTETETNQNQRHQGVWSADRFSLEVTDTNAIDIRENYLRIDGLQIRTVNPTDNVRNPIYVVQGGGVMISNNIIRGHNHPTYTQSGVDFYATGYVERLWNNILYDFYPVSGNNILSVGNVSMAYVYNNTFVGGNRVRANYANNATARNNISIDSINGFSGDWEDSSDYNVSDLAGDDVPGSHSTAGVEPQFANKAGADFHLAAADTVARDGGIDLSADANLSFGSDIDVQSRSSASNWDIGADEYAMADAFTISGWVKMTGSSAASKAIIAKAEELRLATDGAGNPLCQIKSGGVWQTAAVSSQTLELNEWSHVACAYDKSTLKVYVNGVEKDSDSLSMGVDNTTNHLKFGRDFSSGTSYTDFQGFMDEMRIYPYARSSVQMAFDYNAGLSGLSAKKGAGVTFGNESEKWMSDGLVGYWRMNESSWNGTSGEVLDASGNGNNGTASGGATTDIGKFGKGGSFDGVDDLINVGSGSLVDNIETQGGGGFTASAWIYARSYGENNNGYIISKGSMNMTGHWRVMFAGAANWILFSKDYDGASDLYVFVNYPTSNFNTWRYVTVTWDGSVSANNVHIYIDGTEAATTSTSDGMGSRLSDEDRFVAIGASDNYGSGEYSFDGKIDEVRIYNRVLSAEETKKLYDYGPRPITHIKMDEKVSGDTKILYDDSGYQRNASTEQGPNSSGMDCTQRGKHGSSCELDGADDFMQINDYDY